ncbi:MAG: hypothetical protein ACE5Z5_14715 [Candidatus Bathyarchaeia archaeon]
MVTLSGSFTAKEVQTHCPIHKVRYRSEALTDIVPRGCSVGFEVMVFVGLNRWLRHRQVEEIRSLLEALGVEISTGEISILSDRFLLYLQEVHRGAAAEIRELISSQGGYILQVDGTQENGSSVLLTVRDGISGITLTSRLIQTESKDSIVPSLEEVKRECGPPMAVMRDMGSGMEEAVTEVFPGVRQLICHFHFLRDLGKDLLTDMHTRLRKAFMAKKITPRLRRLQRRLYPKAARARARIDGGGGIDWTPQLLVYIAISWILACSRAMATAYPSTSPTRTTMSGARRPMSGSGDT